MYAAPPPDSPGVGDWLAGWWRGFPAFSRAVFFTCLIVYALQLAGVVNLYHWCFNVSDIVEEYQVYRAFTAPYLHGSVLHVLFNLLAFCSLAPPIERYCGSSAFLALTFCLQVLGGVLAVALVWLVRLASLQIAQHAEALVPAATTLEGLFPYNACSIGISGLLFAYLTMETRMERRPRSFCGLFSVPAAAYPWLLLLFIQLLWSNATLTGHLCGVLAGYAGIALNDRLQHLRLDGCVPQGLKAAHCYQAPGGLLPTAGPPAGAAGPPLAVWSPSYRSPYAAAPAPARPGPPPPRFPGQGRAVGSGPAPGRGGGPAVV